MSNVSPERPCKKSKRQEMVALIRTPVKQTIYMVLRHKDGDVISFVFGARKDGYKLFYGHGTGRPIIEEWPGSTYSYKYLGDKNYEQFKEGVKSLAQFKNYVMIEHEEVPGWLLRSDADLYSTLRKMAFDAHCEMDHLHHQTAYLDTLRDLFGKELDDTELADFIRKACAPAEEHNKACSNVL
jgi:hypothetical protein